MALNNKPHLLRLEIGKVLLQTTCDDHSTLTKVGEDVRHVGRRVIYDDLEGASSIRAFPDEDDPITEVGNDVGLKGRLGVVVRDPEEEQKEAEDNDHRERDPDIGDAPLVRALGLAQPAVS